MFQFSFSSLFFSVYWFCVCVLNMYSSFVNLACCRTHTYCKPCFALFCQTPAYLLSNVLFALFCQTSAYSLSNLLSSVLTNFCMLIVKRAFLCFVTLLHTHWQTCFPLFWQTSTYLLSNVLSSVLSNFCTLVVKLAFDKRAFFYLVKLLDTNYCQLRSVRHPQAYCETWVLSKVFFYVWSIFCILTEKLAFCPKHSPYFRQSCAANYSHTYVPTLIFL